jgi:hypothetical protein
MTSSSFHCGTPGLFGAVLSSGAVVSTDGGKSFAHLPEGNQAALPPRGGLVPDLRRETPGSPLQGIPPLHDLGDVGLGGRAANSNASTEWRIGPGTLSSAPNGSAIRILGLGSGVSVEIVGCGAVMSGNGAMLRTAVVIPRRGHGAPQATVLPAEDGPQQHLISLVSTDGFTWQYHSTIPSAPSAGTGSDPSNLANDVAMVDFGMLVVVVTGGAYTVSLDGGASWTASQAMTGTANLAHPRLAMLGDGFAPLVMSSGVLGGGDLNFWVEWTGLGPALPPLPPQWHRSSLSYHHNNLVANGLPRFPPSINTSGSTATTGRTQ